MGKPLARSELLKGARFGSYEVVGLIGHGATASVFSAKHVALGKPVAIKILHEHLAADDELRGRFVREGKVAAQLRHPNVVDVLDVGAQGEVAYLVMERLEGRDLSAHLRQRGRLEPSEALAILLPVASALASAHDLGVVHRDIKPANIFLSVDARGAIVPKLVDFGLSKVVGGPDTMPLTDTGAVVGTMLYMAPEQTVSTKTAGPHSDQYALATVLYECITGSPPFSTETFHELLLAIRNAEVRPPSAVEPSLPKEIDAVLLRALERDPSRRFPGLRAFARALLPFADELTRYAWERDFADPAVTGQVPAFREEVSGTRPIATASPPASDDTVASTRASSVPSLPVPSAPTPSAPAPRSGGASSVRPVPPLPCAPGSSPFHIKGVAYRGVLEMVERRIPGGMRKLMSAIGDPGVVAFLDQTFLAASRYDILPMLPINAAIARLTGVSLEALSRAQGVAQARYDATHVYRAFVARGLREMETRLRRLGAQYYDFGTYGTRDVEPGHLVIQRRGVPEYVARWFAPMHAGYGEEIVRQMGASWAEGRARAPVAAGARAGFALVDIDTDIRWK